MPTLFWFNSRNVEETLYRSLQTGPSLQTCPQPLTLICPLFATPLNQAFPPPIFDASEARIRGTCGASPRRHVPTVFLLQSLLGLPRYGTQIDGHRLGRGFFSDFAGFPIFAQSSSPNWFLVFYLHFPLRLIFPGNGSLSQPRVLFAANIFDVTKNRKVMNILG